MVLAGGPDADLDLANNGAVHRLIKEAIAQKKLISGNKIIEVLKDRVLA